MSGTNETDTDKRVTGERGGADVSVIVNNYNYGRFLGAAIDSALGQAGVQVEVIVVDDGSVDESRAIIAGYGDRIVPVLQPNRGQAAAFNAGFAHSQGRWVIFLDADDLLLPDAARRVTSTFAATPEAAKLMLPMLVVDAAGKPTGERKPAPHLPLATGDLRREVIAFAADLTWLPTSGNAFPRWVLERLLPIPEARYGPVGADWHLSHLAPLNGPVLALDAAGACYRVHGANNYEPDRPELDLAHVRQTIHYAECAHAEMHKAAVALGLVDAATPAQDMAVSSLANRLISLKLDPVRHPVPGDSTGRLLALGMRGALGRFNASWLLRLLFCAWFVAMAVAPRPAAHWLAVRFLHPQARPAFSRVLGGLHHTAGNPFKRRLHAGQGVALLALCGLLLLQLPQVVSARKTIYWGALIAGETYNLDDAPWNQQTIDTFEQHTGQPISILHWGQAWWSCSPDCGYQHFRHQRRQFDAMRARGIIPLVDWAAWDSSARPVTDQPKFALQAIIDGKHDAYIREWATEAKEWSHPFFLRFNWEMNGDWFPWSERVNGNKAGQYVKAWRHVHDIFQEVGANNVTWVWCPNVIYPRAIPLADLYPGDEYVGWVGMDGYNWGTHPEKDDRWKSFTELFGPTYAELSKLAPKKPIMIGETASTEQGASKAAWITDMLTDALPNHFARVEAVLWFNWNTDNMDWAIESSPEAQAAFAAGIGSGYFAGNTFGELDKAPIPALPPEPVVCIAGACVFLPAILAQ